MKSTTHPLRAVLTTTVLVSALGYFVDIYDLVLFSIVRVASLKSMGVADSALLENGVWLLNLQMIGMLIGGVLWGILGDKRGRLSVLFGSIFLYSIANIANGFAHSVNAYGLFRFLAGVGLAGELGAAITLVSETLSKELRGYGTTVVASVGVAGAVVAALIGDTFRWQVAYFVGGGLGLVLLILRINMFESGMYANVKSQQHVRRGDLALLFSSGERLRRYVACILTGIPIWYVIGVLITFSPEITRELGVMGKVVAGSAIMFTYIGLVFGGMASGLLSQKFRSRKKIILAFMLFTGVLIVLSLSLRGMSAAMFYGICVLLGIGTGYWAMFVTVASEHFGTNLRATVTTTAPNFVRGSVVPITLAFRALQSQVGLTQSALWVGMGCLVIALVSLGQLHETFGRDLDYLEENAAGDVSMMPGARGR